jgi:energy-coupling factor transport system substrate-specific component
MLLFEGALRQSRLDMGMSDGVMQQILEVIHDPMIVAAFAGALVCSVIGAFIGKALLKQHFEKVGIV